MKRVQNIFLLFILLIVGGCSLQKEIPADDLEAIIEETILSASTAKGSWQMTKFVEGKDFYTSILKKYGYTVSDFEYTINRLVSRKSEVLNTVMEGARLRIEQKASRAENSYKMYKELTKDIVEQCADSICMVDTIFVIKSADRANKIKYLLPLDDTGDYKLTIKYSTSSSVAVRSSYATIELKDSLSVNFNRGYKASETYVFPYDKSAKSDDVEMTYGFKITSPKDGNILELNLFTFERNDRRIAYDSNRHYKNGKFTIKVKSIMLTKKDPFVSGAMELFDKEYGLKMPKDYIPKVVYCMVPYAVIPMDIGERFAPYQLKESVNNKIFNIMLLGKPQEVISENTIEKSAYEEENLI